MTDLQPSLAKCDDALAQAELLIAFLAADPAQRDWDLSALRQRITTLRAEVERLRGMQGTPFRKRIEPDRTEHFLSPWSPPSLGGTDQFDPVAPTR